MKFIAHRGYSKKYHENTLDAFDAVCSHSQNGNSLIGIETDIQLTIDNRIPILHDTVINDSKGLSFSVPQITYSQLQSLFTEKFKGLSIPDIYEALELINHRTEINLELKDAPGMT